MLYITQVSKTLRTKLTVGSVNEDGRGLIISLAFVEMRNGATTVRTGLAISYKLSTY